MPLLRLLLAFALTIAIPLQGLAAATCMCKLRQARAAASTAGYSADGGGGLASRLVASVSLAHGAPEMAPGSMSTHAKSAGPHGGAPPAHGDKHGACPTCSMSCCQAAVSPPGAPAIELAHAHAEQVGFPPALFASWAEPVPDKPPRT